MVHVAGELHNGAVLFVGEAISCRVTVSNHDAEPTTVSWGSIQAHCQCVHSPARVKLPRSARPQVQATEYAFSPNKGERGRTVWETESEVLFCDLTLQPGETQTYEFSTVVPKHAPPSFKGDSVVYSYKIIIGVQGADIKQLPDQLKIPFRVFPISELQSSHGSSESLASMTTFASQCGSIASESSFRTPDFERSQSTIQARLVRLRLGSMEDSALPSAESSEVDQFSDGVSDITEPCPSVSNGFVLRNPFVEPQEDNWLSRERMLQTIGSLTRRRRTSVFKIAVGNKLVARFHLAKTSFRLGEDVVGWFDLVSSTLRCYQVAVSLEQEESVLEPYRKGPHAVLRTVHARRHVFCRHMDLATVMLPVPLSSTPGFCTDMVEVRWRLAFEFLVGTGTERVETVKSSTKALDGTSKQAVVNTGAADLITSSPAEVDADTMHWSLPIVVLPTNPSNVPFKNSSQQMQTA